MKTISRRTFVGSAASVAALGLGRGIALAYPLGLPLGLQLYSVRDQMKEDLPGTLAGVSAAGYTVVEAAALPNKSAAEVRAALDTAGLRCVSAHHGFNDLHTRFDEVADYDKQLGVKFIICASPGHRDPSSGSKAMALDDWHYVADQFNEMGANLASRGIRFGYHNHVGEFTVVEGKTPYFELLRLTDPAKVTFELDCGWASVAGMNPVELMKTYPHRITMLHVKDFKLQSALTDAHDAKVTELGQGSIDYRPIFAEAAHSQHIEYTFVEQEAFDMPWKDSLKIDADYMRKWNSL